MEILNITNANFETEVLKSEIPVLIDFWAAWCGPCKALAPVIDEIASEVTDVKIGKVNTDESMELARKYRVMSIPTLIYFKNGEVVDTLRGLQSKEDILSLIEKQQWFLFNTQLL